MEVRKDGRRNTRKLASNLVGGLSSLYLITTMVAGAYYNWEYARANGFLNWMLLGEIVPSAKALAWPYFAFAARSNSVSPEDVQTARYFVDVNQAIEDYQKQENALASEGARIAEVFDSREKADPEGARLFLADSMDVLLHGIQPTINKLDQINPPEKLREHYKIVLGCPKTQIDALAKMTIALRGKDQAAYAAQMARFQSSLLDCTGTDFWNRVHAALERAGFHSPDEIDRAVAKGGLK